MKVFKTNVISNKYFCIDIETTGLNEKAEDAGILEIFYKIMENDVEKSRKHLLFFHPAWGNTKDLHKIGYDEIKDQPTFAESTEIKKEIRDLFKRCSDPDDELVFMAQYAPFEFKWFRHHLDLSSEDLEWFDKVKTCDTRHISKMLFPKEPHSLISMCEKYDVGFPEGQHDFHRADQDVKAMYEVFLKVGEFIKSEDLEEYNPDTYRFDFSEKHDNNSVDKESIIKKILKVDFEKESEELLSFVDFSRRDVTFRSNLFLRFKLKKPELFIKKFGYIDVENLDTYQKEVRKALLEKVFNVFFEKKFEVEGKELCFDKCVKVNFVSKSLGFNDFLNPMDDEVVVGIKILSDKI